LKIHIPAPQQALYKAIFGFIQKKTYHKPKKPGPKSTEQTTLQIQILLTVKKKVMQGM
jgi:hypothetical protein